jgi:hypothetical protein
LIDNNWKTLYNEDSSGDLIGNKDYHNLKEQGSQVNIPTINEVTDDTVVQELTREHRDDETLLDPHSNRALISTDLRTFDRAPKDRPTVSTSVPDF